MTLTPDEIRLALDQVEAGRKAARLALRRNCGHYHLWIWGVFWAVVPLVFHFAPTIGTRYTWAFALGGALASALVGIFVERSRIRMPLNARFSAFMAALIVFAAILFILLGSSNPKAIYAYFCTVAMFGYIAAGLWFDVYLVWLGLAATALTLIGFYALGSWFWIWMSVAGGGTLIGTGFYVRYFWKD